ncbi:MAG: twin-arginine translocase subunit TatC [Acetobacteraceae bacterium]|nr:twin-arginine translocase subunit TatC [Acetobacteraceae bacterium]
MPLLEHLVELRTRLIWSIVALAVAFAVCYYFSKNIYTFLAQPLADVLQARSGQERRMIFTALTEAFFTYLKVAMFGAAFISFPITVTQLWLFIAPGLYRSEKRALVPFLVATPVLFLLGGALAYYVVIPMAWQFFVSFEIPSGDGALPIQLEAKVSEYLGLVMKLIFAFGIAFELPVGLTLLAKVGIISSFGLRKYRRYSYVGMFIVAAVLTPPDVISQLGLAIPLIGLYEISVLMAQWVEPKREPEDDGDA